MPILYLTRIEPDTRKGSNILGYPNEERGQYYGQQKWHRALCAIHLKVHFGPEKDDEYICKQKVADVVEKVVCKEIKVYESSKNPKVVVGREVFVRKLEKNEGARNVTSDRRVKKTCKQRHRSNNENRASSAWIRPRTNCRIRFEQFHDGSQHVEKEDDKKLPRLFEPKQECTYLETDCCNKYEVVATDKGNGDDLGQKK